MLPESLLKNIDNAVVPWMETAMRAFRDGEIDASAFLAEATEILVESPALAQRLPMLDAGIDPKRTWLAWILSPYRGVTEIEFRTNRGRPLRASANGVEWSVTIEWTDMGGQVYHSEDELHQHSLEALVTDPAVQRELRSALTYDDQATVLIEFARAGGTLK